MAENRCMEGSKEVKKAGRTALSWPKEYRDNPEPLQQLRKALKLGSGGTVSNGQLFLLAAVLAFNAGKIAPDKIPTANNSVRVEALQEFHRRIFEGMAVFTQQSRKVLLTEDEVFDIAERYAAEGLKMLFAEKEKRTSEDFAYYVSSEIYSAIKKNAP
jgi:hypothetical protein